MLSNWKIKQIGGLSAVYHTAVFLPVPVWPAEIVRLSLFPDEFGYWAPAAEMLGWDWSESVSLGSYYSFGYSPSFDTCFVFL